MRLAGHLVSALVAAEREGIVHRDIKPSNIMLTRADRDWERAVLLDFGLAKCTQADGGLPDLTMPGTLQGTPLYASPEQLSGLATDTRSDIYSLGMTLFEACTGRAPFTGSTAEVIRKQFSENPPYETAPPSLSGLLRKMTAKDPGDRSPSAEVLAKEVAGLRADSGIPLPHYLRKEVGFEEKLSLIRSIAAAIDSAPSSTPPLANMMVLETGSVVVVPGSEGPDCTLVSEFPDPARVLASAIRELFGGGSLESQWSPVAELGEEANRILREAVQHPESIPNASQLAGSVVAALSNPRKPALPETPRPPSAAPPRVPVAPLTAPVDPPRSRLPVILAGSILAVVLVVALVVGGAIGAWALLKNPARPAGAVAGSPPDAAPTIAGQSGPPQSAAAGVNRIPPPSNEPIAAAQIQPPPTPARIPPPQNFQPENPPAESPGRPGGQEPGTTLEQTVKEDIPPHDFVPENLKPKMPTTDFFSLDPETTPTPAVEPASPPPNPTAKHSRYIAVGSGPDENGRPTFMVFDTEKNALVDNQSYTMKKAPKHGTLMNTPYGKIMYYDK